MPFDISHQIGMIVEYLSTPIPPSNAKLPAEATIKKVTSREISRPEAKEEYGDTIENDVVWLVRDVQSEEIWLC